MIRIELTSPDLPAAVQAGDPVEVVDPGTGQLFVLVPAEQYQMLCRAVAGEFDPREGYPLIDQLMKEDDANDPYLQSYQE